MGCKIIFAPEAIRDLANIVHYIAKDDPDAGLRLGNSLIDGVAVLEKFPLLGSPYRNRAGVRKLVRHPYIVFYRASLERGQVDILRYWHGAQAEPDLGG